ncbi:MAG: LysR family transcriptional regulator [Thiotrichaceae bacterium]
MNITFRQLQIYEAVAQTQSYTRAAERLFMTQPAVSMQMKQLEETTGLDLFERQGKKIVITASGEKLRKHANKIIDSFEIMHGSISKLQKGQHEQIKISAATTANHFVTHMMAEFSRLHKEINITLDITNRETLVTQLQNYTPDFVIMGEPPSKLDLDSQLIMENPLIVISSPQHPLVKQYKPKRIPMKEVIKEAFVVREEGSGTKAAIRRHFKKEGYDFISSYEMSSNESIKHAVVAGLGLGIVALHTIKLELEAGKLIILDVENFPLRRHWHLVSRKGRRLSPAATEFQMFILESAESYQEGYKHFL